MSKSHIRYKRAKAKQLLYVILGRKSKIHISDAQQTNDGNTMLKGMSVMHPAAKMLVDLSAAQDVEAGDGTTSVVVIAGSLLGAADRLLSKGRLFALFALKLKTYSLKAYTPPLSQSPSKELRQPR